MGNYTIDYFVYLDFFSHSYNLLAGDTNTSKVIFYLQ